MWPFTLRCSIEQQLLGRSTRKIQYARFIVLSPLLLHVVLDAVAARDCRTRGG